MHGLSKQVGFATLGSNYQSTTVILVAFTQLILRRNQYLQQNYRMWHLTTTPIYHHFSPLSHSDAPFHLIR